MKVGATFVLLRNGAAIFICVYQVGMYNLGILSFSECPYGTSELPITNDNVRDVTDQVTSSTPSDDTVPTNAFDGSPKDLTLVPLKDGQVFLELTFKEPVPLMSVVVTVENANSVTILVKRDDRDKTFEPTAEEVNIAL